MKVLFSFWIVLSTILCGCSGEEPHDSDDDVLDADAEDESERVPGSNAHFGEVIAPFNGHDYRFITNDLSPDVPIVTMWSAGYVTVGEVVIDTNAVAAEHDLSFSDRFGSSISARRYHGGILLAIGDAGSDMYAEGAGAVFVFEISDSGDVRFLDLRSIFPRPLVVRASEQVSGYGVGLQFAARWLIVRYFDTRVNLYQEDYVHITRLRY